MVLGGGVEIVVDMKREGFRVESGMATEPSFFDVFIDMPALLCQCRSHAR
jgi:hypothetical protein